MPIELDRIVGKALEKKPADRYQHAEDVLVDLRRLDASSDKRVSGRSVRAEVVPKRKLRLYQALLGLTGLVALSLAFVHFGETPPAASESPLRKFALRTPVALRFYAQTAISPNGGHIAFVRSTTAADEKLWVHDFDQYQSRALEGTEGALDLFWAPGSDFNFDR